MEYTQRDADNCVNEIYDKKRNTLDLTKCSGLVAYVLSSVHFAKTSHKKGEDEYSYNHVGRGNASTYARFQIDHKVVADKFRMVDDGFDKTLAYLNTGSMELRDSLLEHLDRLRNNYAMSKSVYDKTAVLVFFELENVKLKYIVEGDNILKD